MGEPAQHVEQVTGLATIRMVFKHFVLVTFVSMNANMT